MDDHQRELERALAAAPHDAAANRAFARACERAGDTRRAWPIRCRLAREGDLDSWEVLERRPLGLRRQPEVADFVSLEAGMAPIAGTGSDLLVMLGSRFVQAFTPDGLESIWTRNTELRDAVGVTCGPWIAHTHTWERRLSLLEAATGREESTQPLPGTAAEVHLEARRDRLVARRGNLVMAFDAGARPGEVLSSVTSSARVLGVAGDVMLDQSADDLLTRGRRLEAGDVLWTKDANVVAIDVRGGALVAPARTTVDGADDLLAIDTRDGSTRWETVRVPGVWTLEGSVWVQVGLREVDQTIREVRGLAQADGRELWRARGQLVGERLLTQARAADVHYLALEGARRTVVGLDLQTGEVLFVHGLVPRGRVWLVPTEGGLIVVTHDGRTRVERLA